MECRAVVSEGQGFWVGSKLSSTFSSFAPLEYLDLAKYLGPALRLGRGLRPELRPELEPRRGRGRELDR